jgi:hypothetical protein
MHRLSHVPFCEQIFVGSTDFDVFQTEVRTIVGTTSTTITLDTPLLWEHWGKPVATGVPGKYLPQVRLPSVRIRLSCDFYKAIWTS